MKAFFITGTDTGVGKTVVTGLLARYLTGRGYRVATQKWVETGARGFSSDVEKHLRLMGKNRRDAGPYLKHMSCYCFRHPSSPHLSASLEKRSVDIGRIKKSFAALKKTHDIVLVEGSGGLLVPLTVRKLMVDMANDLGLAALIVAGNKLGAINHTLLTVEALKMRGIDITGIIFNGGRNTPRAILKDNPEIIRRFTGVEILGVLPVLGNKDALFKKFIPIGRSWIKNERLDKKRP